jgi:HEAT repeat protein/cyclophilin family peptidyl-prolyl cis-trans isomerase
LPLLASVLVLVTGCQGRSEIGDIAALEDTRNPGGGRLAAALASPNNGIRARASRAAARIASPDLVAPLAALLHDPDRTVVREAAFALGRIAERHAPVREAITDSLAACLRDLGAGLGSAHDDVVDALGRAGGRSARQPLLQTLTQPRLGARATAAVGLRRIGVAPDDSLVATLLQDPSAAVRLFAATALDRSRDPRALRILAARIDDNDAGVRRAVLRSLASARAPDAREAIARRLSGSEWDPVVQATALVSLDRVCGAGRSPGLSHALVHPYASSPAALVRRAAARALRSVDPSLSLSDLLALSRDRHALVRAEAARSLAPVSHPSAQARLVELSADSSTAVRAAAARSLARSGGLPPAVEERLALDPALRAGAIEGRLCAGAPDAALLRDALSDSADMVVAGAIRALGRWANERPNELVEHWRSLGANLEEELVEHLHASASPELKLAAIELLRTLPSTGSCRAARWLRDPSLAVRLAAREISLRSGSNCPSPSLRTLTSIERPISDAAPYPTIEILPQRAEVVTTAGTFVVALFTADTPRTIAAFSRLARAGAFEGLGFPIAEVDSLTVVGPPLGAPEGAPLDLRTEVTPSPMGRGMVATRSVDEESPRLGFMIAVGYLPELSGRCTVFGEIVHGMNVIDQIDTEDRILRVTTR